MHEIGNAKGLQEIAEAMGFQCYATLDGWRLMVKCTPQQLVEMGMRLERRNVKESNRLRTIGELEREGKI